MSQVMTVSVETVEITDMKVHIEMCPRHMKKINSCVRHSLSSFTCGLEQTYGCHHWKINKLSKCLRKKTQASDLLKMSKIIRFVFIKTKDNLLPDKR